MFYWLHAAQVGKDKSMRVLVVKIHPPENQDGETAEKKLEGACDSPSSDKENASQENQRKEPSPQEEDSRRESLSESTTCIPFQVELNGKSHANQHCDVLERDFQIAKAAEKIKVTFLLGGVGIAY